MTNISQRPQSIHLESIYASDLDNSQPYDVSHLMHVVDRIVKNPVVVKTGLLTEIIAFALMYAKGPCKDISDTQYFNEIEQALTDAFWDWYK